MFALSEEWPGSASEQPDSGSDQHQDDERLLGELDDAIDALRAKLKDGGPDVDFNALYAFVADALAAPDEDKVWKLITAWRPWFDAYTEIQANLDWYALHYGEESASEETGGNAKDQNDDKSGAQ